MYEVLEKKLDLVSKLVEKTGDEELIAKSKFLYDRIKYPDSYVTMLGETSSGKTTLLNGILGENYLYTSASPSTGTIIELEITPEEIDHQYNAILNDAKRAVITKEKFIDLSKMWKCPLNCVNSNLQ